MAFDPHKIRLFTDAALAAGMTVGLNDGQSHYLRNVMRRAEGDTVHLFNGRDGEWRCTLTMVSKKAAQVSVDGQVRAQMTPPDLVLCFAPVKGARLDFVAQKATELGVSALQPVITERTVVRRVKVEKLRANAIEAAEQCEGLWVPAVAEPLDLPSLLGGWPAGRGLLFCDEGGQGDPISTLSEHADSFAGWGVVVGPEGGFTDRERSLIREHPRAVSIGLGPRIMRADTAALAALGLLQACWGDWVHSPRQA